MKLPENRRKPTNPANRLDKTALLVVFFFFSPVLSPYRIFSSVTIFLFHRRTISPVRVTGNGKTAVNHWTIFLSRVPEIIPSLAATTFAGTRRMRENEKGSKRFCILYARIPMHVGFFFFRLLRHRRFLLLVFFVFSFFFFIARTL